MADLYAGSNKTPFSNVLSNFMQARQSAATSRLMAPAMSGDLSALNELMSVNPQAGMQVQGMMAQRQQQEAQARQQSFENELAMKKFGLSEQELELARQRAQQGPGSQLKAFQPQLMENTETGKLEMMVPVVDENTGQARWEPISGAGGFGVARETPEQAREREAAAKVKTAKETKIAETTADIDNNQFTTGVKAWDAIPDIERMIDLNDSIETGGLVKGVVKAGELFGVTPADIGEFRSLQRNYVLDKIKSLGTNPTDTERMFLESTLANLEQGKDVNKATLKRLLAIQKAQVARGRAASKRLGIEFDDYVGGYGGESQQPAPAPAGAKFLGFE